MNEKEVAEILAKELAGENDWFQISRREDMTIEQLKLFKDHLLWEVVIGRYKKLPNDLLDQMIQENKIGNGQNTWKTISQKHAVDKEFIKKYNDKIDMRDLARENNFKPSELIEMFGRPEVGTGATECYASDSHPFTVIEVSRSGLKIKLQADKAIHGPNFDYFGNQEYTYEPDTNGIIIEATLRKDGRWKSNSTTIALGYRREYQNPSF